MPEDIKDSSLEESLQLLKDNPPVEPDKDELEDFQYESAKLRMIKQLQALERECRRTRRTTISRVK